MEYHKTKNILHVQKKMGHRDLKSTLIYTHLVNFEADEYHTATSKSLKEDEELLKAGFEYVTERDGIKIYRKRKRAGIGEDRQKDWRLNCETSPDRKHLRHSRHVRRNVTHSGDIPRNLPFFLGWSISSLGAHVQDTLF